MKRRRKVWSAADHAVACALYPLLRALIAAPLKAVSMTSATDDARMLQVVPGNSGRSRACGYVRLPLIRPHTPHAAELAR